MINSKRGITTGYNNTARTALQAAEVYQTQNYVYKRC